MSDELPITLVLNMTANGESVECFLKVGGIAVFGPGGVGAFLNKPTLDEALREALKIALRSPAQPFCDNCSEPDRLLHQTLGRGMVCERCIKANVALDPQFAKD